MPRNTWKQLQPRLWAYWKWYRRSGKVELFKSPWSTFSFINFLFWFATFGVYETWLIYHRRLRMGRKPQCCICLICLNETIDMNRKIINKWQTSVHLWFKSSNSRSLGNPYHNCNPTISDFFSILKLFSEMLAMKKQKKDPYWHALKSSWKWTGIREVFF